MLVTFRKSNCLSLSSICILSCLWSKVVTTGVCSDLFFNFFFCQQINGIALDNKSLSECESLLRNCHDSLSISLMKVKSSDLQHMTETITDLIKDTIV